MNELDRARWRALDAHRAVALATNEAARARLAEDDAADRVRREQEALAHKRLKTPPTEWHSLSGALSRVVQTLMRCVGLGHSLCLRRQTRTSIADW